MDWLLIGASTPWFLNLSTWLTILQVALGLGFVIFVHELGHFAVAKLCGVKCEKFYVGFDVPLKLGWGKYAIRLPSSLWKKTWGETTYGIGVIPLGGYVKMLGQDDNPARAAEAMRRAKEVQAAKEKGESIPAGLEDNEDYILDPRSYMAQSVPERMAIISAGVIMNLIFAFIFAVIAFMMGVKYTPCVVGHSIPGGPGWLAGTGPGDEFLSVGSVEKPRFKDLQVEVVLGNAKSGIPAKIKKYGTETVVEENYKPDEVNSDIVNIPMIGVAMEKSLNLSENSVVPGSQAAAAVGKKDTLSRGTIVAINGEPIENYTEYQAIRARNVDKPLTYTIERIKEGQAGKEQPETERVEVTVDPTPMRWFGLTMTMGPISGVQRGSPAAEAMGKNGVEGGIKKGDRLVSIDGEPIGDPMTLPQRMRAKVGKAVNVVVKRTIDDETKELEFVVTLRNAGWTPQSGIANSPLEVPTMGICYDIRPVVKSVEAGGPADKAGIKVGDTLMTAQIVPANDKQKELEEDKGFLKLNEKFDILKPKDGDSPELNNWVNIMYDSPAVLEPDTAFDFGVKRGDASKLLQLKVVPVEYKGFFVDTRGIRVQPNHKIQQAKSFKEALYFAYRETRGAMLQVVLFLKKLTTGQLSPTMLGGPGTIAAAAGGQASQGFPKFLVFLTLLSANLAVVNFLPIPVLDGGHMVFLLAEGVTGKPVSEKIATPLTYLGLFFILGLMIFVIGLDVKRFLPFLFGLVSGFDGFL